MLIVYAWDTLNSAVPGRSLSLPGEGPPGEVLQGPVPGETPGQGDTALRAHLGTPACNGAVGQLLVHIVILHSEILSPPNFNAI